MSRNWSSYAFGDKFDGHLTYEWPSLNDDGTYTMMEWRPRNFFAGFFDTGVTWNNNISVSGNNGKGSSIRVSFTDTRNTWIVPNTGYKSQSFSVSFAQKLRIVELAGKVNYYRKDSDNLPMTGYGGSSIMYPLLWNTPNVDAQWFKADYKKWVREGGDLSKSTQHVSANGNNPYYTAYEQLNKLDRDRVFGNLAATINFTEELSLILRCGMDLNNDFRTQQKPKGAKTYINGMYKEQTVFDYEMNNDFLLRYTKKLNDFDLSASFGGNNMMQSYRSNTSLAESLVVDRDYRLSNSVDRPKVTSIRRQKSINSFYGLISASWRNMIFLDVTGRNDWSSTLAPGNNSYFYPSVSGSVILSDLLHIDTPMVNFLKVRASWANVGNDTSPYQLLNYYNNSSFTGGWEVSARIQPVRNKNIRWDMNFTWSRNRNKVVELAPNLDSWTIATGPRGEIRAVPGGSLGDLYGSGYEKAPKGSYVTADDGSTIDVSGWDIVDSDGYPVLASEFENLGNTQADWKAGWMNSISYKNFRLSFSFSAQWGGQAYSFTNAMLGYQGKIKATLPGRYDGLIHKGVNQNADGTYSINKTVTASIESYYNLRVFNRDNVVNNTFSTSFLKMKDIRLEYSLPKKIAAKTKVLQGASIAFFATNLFCWTNWPQFDPEIATMNGSEITKGFETAAFPMTRTYGVNLKLQF